MKDFKNNGYYDFENVYDYKVIVPFFKYEKLVPNNNMHNLTQCFSCDEELTLQEKILKSERMFFIYILLGIKIRRILAAKIFKEIVQDYGETIFLSSYEELLREFDIPLSDLLRYCEKEEHYNKFDSMLNILRSIENIDPKFFDSHHDKVFVDQKIINNLDVSALEFENKILQVISKSIGGIDLVEGEGQSNSDVDQVDEEGQPKRDVVVKNKKSDYSIAYKKLISRDRQVLANYQESCFHIEKAFKVIKDQAKTSSSQVVCDAFSLYLYCPDLKDRLLDIVRIQRSFFKELKRSVNKSTVFYIQNVFVSAISGMRLDLLLIHDGLNNFDEIISEIWLAVCKRICNNSPTDIMVWYKPYGQYQDINEISSQMYADMAHRTFKSSYRRLHLLGFRAYSKGEL